MQHKWEPKVLGFALSWWLLALGRAWPLLFPATMIVALLALGALAAIFVAAADEAAEPTGARSIAQWFLLGILSMPLAALLALAWVRGG